MFFKWFEWVHKFPINNINHPRNPLGMCFQSGGKRWELDQICEEFVNFLNYFTMKYYGIWNWQLGECLVQFSSDCDCGIISSWSWFTFWLWTRASRLFVCAGIGRNLIFNDNIEYLLIIIIIVFFSSLVCLFAGHWRQLVEIFGKQYANMDSLPPVSRDHLMLQPLQPLRSSRGSSSNLRASRSPSTTRSSEQSNSNYNYRPS